MPQGPNPAPDPGSEPGHPADAQPAGHGPAAPRATAFPPGAPSTPPQASHDQLNELLATIAHELRRPLAALLGILATLQHRGDALPPGDRDELFAVARRQGDQLTSLLDQLRLAAHPHHPAGPPGLPLIDAAEVARQAGQAARLAGADHPVTVDVTGPLPVQADPLAVSRILGNLLDNAAKHAHGPTPIRLAAARDGDWAVFVVEDAGPGIPAGQREHIFEPYDRLDPAATPHGLGLGLHIARRLARANHGDVHVGDPGGRGARFELHLPLAGHRSAAPPPG